MPAEPVAANLGARPLVTAADDGTQNPLILVNVDFAVDAAPQNPAITPSHDV